MRANVRHVHRTTRRGTTQRAASLALALSACALLLLTLAAFNFGTPASASNQPQPHASNLAQVPSPTATTTGSPTVTATATSTPGVITLDSPSYGSGPAGAHITISGTGFSGTSVTLKAATHADCSGTLVSLDQVTLNGGGFSGHTFIWPLNLPTATYYLCADGTTSGPAYEQLTTSAPSLSLSAPSVAQQDQLVISGSNFAGLPAGASISLTAEQGKATASLPAAVVDANGQFTDLWTVDLSLTGTVVLIAQSAPEGSAPAVLQATASVNILPPATATPTTTVSPTATTSVSSGAGNSGNTGSGGGGTLVIVVVLLLVALLVGGGGIAYLLLRRGGGGPPEPYRPPSGPYPGYSPYSPYGPSSSSGGDTTTRGMDTPMLPGQTYGNPGMGPSSGFYDTPGGYPRSGAGAVSQWDEPTDGFGGAPGPIWQPRPMTGYGDYPVPPQTAPDGDYPPQDPWGNPTTGYGGGYGVGQDGAETRQGRYGGYGNDPRTWNTLDVDPRDLYSGGAPGQIPRSPNQYPTRGYGQAPGAGWPDDDPAGNGSPDDWRQ
jgi:hypothetical protein